MIYIGVVGSRERNEKEKIRELLIKHIKEYGEITVVSGGAKGVDKQTEEVCNEQNISIIVYLPNYDDYKFIGNDIYSNRNREIAKKSDILIAFPHRMRGGTINTIEHFIELKGTNNLIIIQD